LLPHAGGEIVVLQKVLFMAAEPSKLVSEMVMDALVFFFA
jgi:hypothetical protein